MSKIISMFTKKVVTEEEALNIESIQKTKMVNKELAKLGIIFYGLDAEEDKELVDECARLLEYFKH